MFATNQFKHIICAENKTCKRKYCWFTHSKDIKSTKIGPKVSVSVNNKVAWKLRQLWANRYYEKLLILEETDPIELSLKIEAEVHDKAENKTYTSLALSRLNTLGVLPIQATIDVDQLRDYLMTREDLIEYKYPVEEMEKKLISIVDENRTCVRCKSDFKVKETLSKDDMVACTYHPSRVRTVKEDGNKNTLYWCCDSDLTSNGCCIGCHVYQFDEFEDLNAVAPFKMAKKSIEHPLEIAAIDCEMVYTAGGFELARCTIVDKSNFVVYDKLIQPLFPVYDYNTKYSGITSLINEISFIEFQNDLFTIIDHSTLLVGHSLDSDFKAMRLIHHNVIDTAKLFPHHNGLPFKYSLKKLALERLQKIIQNGTQGHDSKEDAITAMELVFDYIRNK